jgi:hypothetical protein
MLNIGIYYLSRSHSAHNAQKNEASPVIPNASLISSFRVRAMSHVYEVRQSEGVSSSLEILLSASSASTDKTGGLSMPD